MQKTILVFSDSHGATFNMSEVIKKYPDAECVIHLGDGVEDTKYLTLPPTTGLLTVRGNCDAFSNEPKELFAELCGLWFLICHGDAYDVKHGIERYEKYAVKRGADIALFGHTHSKYKNEIKTDGKTVYVFNPGSISLPDMNRPSYGVIKIDGGRAELVHKTV